MEAELLDTKFELKQATKSLIYNGDPVLRQNLRAGTQILHSKDHPTQVFNLKGTKYIRVNTNDIQAFAEDADDMLPDLLKLMLASKGYSHIEEDDAIDLSTVVEDAVKEYKSWTGEDLAEGNLIEMDAFRNYIGDKVPLQVKTFRSTSKKDADTENEEKELEESDDITAEVSSLANAMDMSVENTSSIEVDIPDANQEKHRAPPTDIEQALNDVEQYSKMSRFSSAHSILEADQLTELNQMAKQLLKAFKGTRSKEKTITPKKHMNAKALSMDGDRIYIDRKSPKGKHIHLNLVIDMSGSMSGEPMRNAVSLLYLFNKLAQDGYVNGSILYSSTDYHYKIDMPVTDAEILSIHRTRDSEGLTDTVEHYHDILKNTNLICITDGHIVDRPIDKNFWLKHNIVSTGVYINSTIDDVLEYTGTMDTWFNHSLVRQNLNDMIELLIRIGIRG